MSLNEERAYELLERSLQLEDGDELLAVCEEAMREADLSGDLEAQYYAREQFVRASVFGGETDRAMVAFAWLLAQFDRNPGMFDDWRILWKYKWMVGLACDFPQISKKRIVEMLDDLSERSQKAGFGLRAAYTLRYRVEKFWDNRPVAVENFRIMEGLPADDLSNCPACELDEQVGFALYCGQNERAVELADPLLSGWQKCTTVPHRTYASLLVPMVQLGRQEEALDYHRAGYRLISKNKDYLDKIGEHLMFLALTENFDRAIEVFEKHYRWTEQSRNLADRFRFFRASWFLFDVLTERDRSPSTLRMPKSFPLYSEDETYDTGRLAGWFKRQAEDLAKRFDERNETDSFARTLSETPARKRLCAPFPLGEVDA